MSSHSRRRPSRASAAALASAVALATIVLIAPSAAHAEAIATQSSHTAVASAAARTLTAATPKISGNRSVGSTLKVTTGTWTTGTAFSYRWYVNDKPITGATRSTYVLPSGTESKRITVTVTGRKSGYTTLTKTSVATAKILRVATPTIGGKTQTTRTLTASTGTWTNGTIFTYQWYANGTAIKGATAKKYTLTTAQVGKKIVVKVTGRQSGYPTITKSSAATSAIGYPSSTSPVDSWTCPSWAPIKGNASSMIYHMPGQRYYNATKPEACFSTEKAARAAGYRAAKV